MVDKHVPWLDSRETHCAGVVLVDETALKFKKPLDLGFLDFSTRPARQLACEREVELNRRFSPGVYQGVAHLTMPDGTSEPLVVMRRMPDARRLSHLVVIGADVSSDLRKLARSLAVAHSRSQRRDEIDREASREQLRSRWELSFAQVREHLGDGREDRLAALDDIESSTRRFLDGRQALFSRRVAEGHAVDGHGDLLADDVFCLEDGPVALDCLEFDDGLRFVDGLDDVCFLAMDLERLGAPEHAKTFLDAYEEFSGDGAPPALIHHYIAYRAFVRAKVLCLRAEQDPSAAAGFDDHLELTRSHLSAGAVTLTLVGGPPGSGKSTVASGIADRLGMVVISADRVRKELAGIDPQTSAAAPYGTGIFSDAHTTRTYDEILDRASALLALGESVVLDASWTRGDLRAVARAVAERTSSDLVELRCAAGRTLEDARVTARRGDRDPDGTSRTQLSDADVFVATAMRADAAPWPDSTEIDTAGAIDDAVSRAVQYVWSSTAASPVSPRRRSYMAPD